MPKAAKQSTPKKTRAKPDTPSKPVAVANTAATESLAAVAHELFELEDAFLHVNRLADAISILAFSDEYVGCGGALIGVVDELVARIGALKEHRTRIWKMAIAERGTL
jgi:hypothetical protein